MNPAHAEHFVNLKNRLLAAPQGQRGEIVKESATLFGCAPTTIYRRLEEVGWTSGRKARADCGKLCIDENLAMKAAGMVKIATRANGKKTMPLKLAVDIMEQNGLGPKVDKETGEVTMPHPGTVARAMMAYGCHPSQVERGSPAQSLRSLHPNHVWEMDASVCVIFYLPRGKVKIVNEAEAYKNKPKNLAKVDQARVIRWVITDHYSDTIFARYSNGAEDSEAAISVLIEAMCKRDYEGGIKGDIFHGAPFIFYTDKGSPFISTLTRSLLTRLKVRYIDHAAGNARATGQVEHAHNIVETQFEGRLRFLEIDSLETLNKHLDDWRIKWNATAIHSRHGKTRNQMWLKIKPEELRVPESAEALKAIVHSPLTERAVRGNLILSFTPKGFDSQDYSLIGIPGIVIGNKIGVCVNPYEAPAVDVIVTVNGEEQIYTLQPLQKDEAGFYLNSPVIGEEFKALPDTATDQAIKRMQKEAYGAETLEEVAKAARSKRRVYEDIDVMADMHAVKTPLYFPARGSGLSLDTPARELAPVSRVEAARLLRDLLAAQGIEWSGEHMAALERRYPDGVPADHIDNLAAEFIAQARGAALHGFAALADAARADSIGQAATHDFDTPRIAATA